MGINLVTIYNLSGFSSPPCRPDQPPIVNPVPILELVSRFQLVSPDQGQHALKRLFLLSMRAHT